MFSLNGIALDNAELDWKVLAGTTVLTEIGVERPDLVIGQQDGNLAGLFGRAAASPIVIKVRTPRTYESALRAVFRRPGLVLTDSNLPGLEAVVELRSLSAAGYGAAEELVDLTAVLGLPGVFWRDVATATSPLAALTGSGQAVTVMAGLSAPVRDAIVRLRGGLTSPRVQDSNGSWIQYNASIPGGQYLRFESATGRAFLTTSDTWTGGTEVTTAVGNGSGPYPLELTPYFTTDPTVRSARLTVTYSGASGAPGIEIRGKRAHEV